MPKSLLKTGFNLLNHLGAFEKYHPQFLLLFVWVFPAAARERETTEKYGYTCTISTEEGDVLGADVAPETTLNSF